MSSPQDAPEPPADAAAPDGSPADAAAADDETAPPDAAIDEPSSVPEIDLRPALERLRIERRILGDEQCAFRSFCDRLVALDGAAPTDTIVSHYRETVMAVPHYWTEYGDTAAESLAAEIGPSLARDLELGTHVEAPTVTAIRRAGERSLRARDQLVDRIDAERHAVATAAEELNAVRRALLEFDEAAGAEASRLRLAALRERCDAVARGRREQLQPEKADEAAEVISVLSGSGDSVGAWDPDEGLPPGRLQSLCYRELEVDWPVLAGVEALREAIERRRRKVLDRETED